MNKIRTAIWDCDNTIWLHKKNEAEIMAGILGITEAKEFSSEFYNMIVVFNSYFKDKKVTLKEMYKVIENEMPILFLYEISAEKFFSKWNENSYRLNDFNEDTICVMEFLKKKGIKIVVKSDWWRDVQISLLKRYRVLDYIEQLYSCDNDYLKCNPLSAKNIIVEGREDEYVIIGDSLLSDIAFAEHSGIKSIWFNPNCKENKTPFKPSCEIISLLEIMQLF